MPLRERDRFLKLSDAEVDDCLPGEVGWLNAWETETNGVLFEMTTDRQKTLEAIMEWAREHSEELGQFEIETDGKVFAFVQNWKPMPFEKAMMILNNFR